MGLVIPKRCETFPQTRKRKLVRWSDSLNGGFLCESEVPDEFALTAVELICFRVALSPACRHPSVCCREAPLDIAIDQYCYEAKGVTVREHAPNRTRKATQSSLVRKPADEVMNTCYIIPASVCAPTGLPTVLRIPLQRNSLTSPKPSLVERTLTRRFILFLRTCAVPRGSLRVLVKPSCTGGLKRRQDR